MATRTLDEVSCALSAGRERTHFKTLGESGRVARGSVETLQFFLTACVRNARSYLWRAWSSASSLMGGGRGARARVLVCSDRVVSVCGDRMGRFCGDRMGRFCSDRVVSVCGDRTGRFCGDRMVSVSGDRMGRLICYTESRSTR